MRKPKYLKTFSLRSSKISLMRILLRVERETEIFRLIFFREGRLLINALEHLPSRKNERLVNNFDSVICTGR